MRHDLAGACIEVNVTPETVRLSIDTATLKHLAVGARGLVRFRVEHDGPHALGATLLPRLSGEPLDALAAAGLVPGRPATLALTLTPAVAGFHELDGELAVVDPQGARTRFHFANVHLRAAPEGPQVNVVHIDQSSARVIDNSRSTFGSDGAAGIVGEGEWQPIALTVVPDAVRPAPASTRADFTVTTERATYRATEVLAHGDLATIFAAGTHVLKIADATSDNDLLQHEVRVLAKLAGDADGPAKFLAQPRDEFRTSDGRIGTVFDRLDRVDHDGGLDLTAVRDRCRARGEPGLPARHLIWVLRRCLAVLGHAHRRGILHGNLHPSHILVRGRDHMVWLVDWCWAVVDPAHTGQGWKTLDETFSPPEVRERGCPTPASDLYTLGKCAIWVAGGDPDDKTLPDDLDPRLVRFLRYLVVESQGGRPQDAWDLYSQLEQLRTQIWGPHEFVPLHL